IEDAFEKLPIHWMWWPALGGVAVGLVGLVSPSTLGVGYDNVAAILNGEKLGAALAFFAVMKFVSWSISLGSGTSGGTLAPLLTIGGGAGALLGAGLHALFPHAAIDPRVAALVGMAALFGGASRAMMASVVFAFEVTLQPLGLLPLLAGCAASYLVSARMMRHSIMTEKIARRGVRVPSEYAADYLDRVLVRDVIKGELVTLVSDRTVKEVRAWMAARAPGSSHQGFPILNAEGRAIGVLTRRDLLNPDVPEDATLGALVKRTPLIVFADNSLREAADHMVRGGVGRLLVVDPSDATRPIGIITRSDLLNAHRNRLTSDSEATGKIPLPSRSLLRRRA
ncbi:MAG: chloride channel protein, partial [Myxococcaceae bacterium]|nr:chloride channel protein [Myxococcaceae bacterium]